MLLSISLEPIPIEIDQLKANESTSSKRQTDMARTHLVANLNMVELEYSMTRKGRIIFFAMNDEQQLIQRRPETSSKQTFVVLFSV